MLSETLKHKLAIPVFQDISEIHWRSQDSTESSLLFYKIVAGQEHLFQERISTAKFAWIILNQSHASAPENSSIMDEVNWPELQYETCNELYPIPAGLKIIGITGTNGKTTTTDLVLQLGTLAGKSGISIGTLGVRENQKTIEDFGLTSPPYIDLRKYLATYGKDRDFCVLEASSHALDQHRLYKLNFSAAGWLSFSQDHLDYHKSMEEYFKAKAKIANHLAPPGKLFVPAEQTELKLKLKEIGIEATSAPTIEGDLPLFFSTRFNRNNLEVAHAIITSVFPQNINLDFSRLLPPDGRFFIKPYRRSFIVVDFAHTPDALENICQGIRTSFPSHRLKVLFGCGGDRDRLKRPLMAAVVEKFADFIYVTSDNPRSENPEQILDDIIKGIKKKPFLRIVDRPTAVHHAFDDLQDDEVLLLAGKGHEDYILINGVKHPYSDIKEVNDFLARNGL
jgi:UDP-N-acetylmuramoyl-L-alanyl-D-glutamate--2,6-diaminopimelate ligase